METGPTLTQAHTCKCRKTLTYTCCPLLITLHKIGHEAHQIHAMQWSLYSNNSNKMLIFLHVKQGRNKAGYIIVFLSYTSDREKNHWINVNESIASSSCASTESNCSLESLSKGKCRRTGHEPALCLLYYASTQSHSLVLFCLQLHYH